MLKAAFLNIIIKLVKILMYVWNFYVVPDGTLVYMMLNCAINMSSLTRLTIDLSNSFVENCLVFFKLSN